MGIDPLSALNAAKAAFGESSEAQQLADCIDALLRHGSVDWLEVGAGDGRNLAFLLERLRRTRQIRAIALEPVASRPGNCSSSAIAEWLPVRVDDYRPSASFDCINVRHSAYYFDRPAESILQLARWLTPGGVLVLTHWSRACALYTLHEAICRAASCIPCPSVEDLREGLSGAPGLEVLDAGRFPTELRMDVVKTDEKAAAALFDLSRRNRPTTIATIPNRAAFTRTTLAASCPSGAPHNGILCFRRDDVRPPGGAPPR